MPWWVTPLVAVVLIPLVPAAIVALKRNPPKGAGGLGAGLAELQQAFDPSRRHVVAARDARPSERESGEPPEGDA